MRDGELIKRAQEGRPGAFDELYLMYFDAVDRQLTGILGPDRDKDDVLQKIFLRVHASLNEVRDPASFSGWLRRVVVSCAMSHLRERKVRANTNVLLGENELVESVVRDTPEATLARRQELATLYAILAEMKPKKRVVFVLYEIEGHTLEEIAAELDTSINTVATRLRAARAEVQKALRARRSHENLQQKVTG